MIRFNNNLIKSDYKFEYDVQTQSWKLIYPDGGCGECKSPEVYELKSELKIKETFNKLGIAEEA